MPFEARNATKIVFRNYRWIVLAGIWFIYFGFGLTVSALAPLVNCIRDELDFSDAAMGSVLGAWPLVYILAALPCGAVLDRFGTRRTLAFAALIISLSGLLRCLADTHIELVLAVAVFGLGGPLISIGAPKLVTHLFEGKDRGLAMGIYITGPSVGSILALSLTNSIAMPFFDENWRHVILLYSAIAGASGLLWIIICLRTITTSPDKHIRIKRSRSQIEVFCQLLKLPTVQLLLLMSIGIFFFNHGLNNWLPEILRRGGMDTTSAGYWAAIPTLVGIIGALLIPRMATPTRRFSIFGFLIACAGIASLLLQLVDHKHLLILGLFLQGIARSSLMTLAMLILVETEGVGTRNAGAAGGLFFCVAEIGGVLGPVTLGGLSDLTGNFDSGLYLLTGLTISLWFLLMRLRRLQ